MANISSWFVRQKLMGCLSFQTIAAAARQQSLLAEAHAAGTLADADSSSTGMALTTSSFSAACPFRCSSPPKTWAAGACCLMGCLAMMQCATPGPAPWRKVTCQCSYRRRTFPVYRQRRLDLLPLSALRAADRKRTSWSEKEKEKPSLLSCFCCTVCGTTMKSPECTAFLIRMFSERWYLQE